MPQSNVDILATPASPVEAQVQNVYKQIEEMLGDSPTGTGIKLPPQLARFIRTGAVELGQALEHYAALRRAERYSLDIASALQPALLVMLGDLRTRLQELHGLMASLVEQLGPEVGFTGPDLMPPEPDAEPGSLAAVTVANQTAALLEQMRNQDASKALAADSGMQINPAAALPPKNANKPVFKPAVKGRIAAAAEAAVAMLPAIAKAAAVAASRTIPSRTPDTELEDVSGTY